MGDPLYRECMELIHAAERLYTATETQHIVLYAGVRSKEE